MRRFRTDRYSAAWFPREADRDSTRRRIESVLRDALHDPLGELCVERDGPRWVGVHEIGISYAHDADSVLLVWTPDGQPVGADLEPSDRIPGHPVDRLASRFFHPNESRAISLLDETLRTGAFLDLWLKKEAVAKLTRKGLVHSLPLDLASNREIVFEEPALLPLGKRAVLAFFKSPNR